MAFFQFLNDFFRFCVAVRRGRFTFFFLRFNEGLTFYSSRSYSFDCKFLVNSNVFHLWHCYHVPGTQNPLNKCQSTETYTAWKVSVFGVILVRILPHSYSVRMRENADQYNSEYGHFLCCECCLQGFVRLCKLATHLQLSRKDFKECFVSLYSL